MPMLFSVLGLLLLPSSVSPSMLVLTASGARSPKFPVSISSVKAFSDIGPDSLYKSEFSSLDHDAPLVYLDPTDKESCPRCCDAFSPHSSLPLSPIVASLVANKTVMFRRDYVESCSPLVNVVSGFDKMHVVLENAGARAVVFVCTSIVPGVVSNLGGSFCSLHEQHEARASLVPMVAVGSEVGERLIKAVRAPNTSSSLSPPSLHVVFKYDTNQYIHDYHSYYEIPFKFVSFFTFAAMACRCRNLGIHFYHPPWLLGLPCPLLTTKNLIVLMALPVAFAIMTMVSLNGMTSLDEGSRGCVYYTVALMFPFLNVSSSIIVARFWSSRRAHLTANESGAFSGELAKDPAKTHPVTTLLIVFGGVAGDILLSTFLIFSESSHSRRLIAGQIFGSLMAISYILTTAYFFYSGIIVLRSLSSSNKPLKAMASYMLMVAGFTALIIASFVIVGTGVNYASVEGFFLNTVIFCKEEEEEGGGMRRERGSCGTD